MRCVYGKYGYFEGLIWLSKLRMRVRVSMKFGYGKWRREWEEQYIKRVRKLRNKEMLVTREWGIGLYIWVMGPYEMTL